MKLKRAVFMAVLVVAIAALAVPLLGLRAVASSSGASASGSPARNQSANAATRSAQQGVQTERRDASEEVHVDRSQAGTISAETLKALGITRAADPKAASEKIGKMLRNKNKNSGGGDVSIQSGTPLNLDARSALSDALILALGGRDNQFSEVALIADWDGREDCVADREQKVDDFSGFEFNEPDQELTRTAISEHTVANGFNENVYYYGDSVGDLFIGTDTNPGQPGLGGRPVGQQIDALLTVNLPRLQNTGSDAGFTLPVNSISGCLDDQVVVTGIAVNPVADLCDFGLAGTIGEIVYVSITDTEGCAAVVLGGGSIIARASIYEFALRDVVGGVAPAGVRRIFASTLVDFAGVAVDDDGSIYFQLADVITFTGGAIFKVAEQQRTTCGGTACISRVIPVVTSFPTTINVWQGTTANPILVQTGVNGLRGTNYSGPSTLFGDIIAINSGPCNVLYAAVSASFQAGPVSFEQLAQGLFPAPSAFGVGTPSMVISFADCSGSFDVCSGSAFVDLVGDPNVGGTLPTADGFADAVQAGLTRTPGVNNFRVFVQGNPSALKIPNTSPVVGLSTGASALQVDMQIDYVPAHAGIAVSQEGAVFVISGGAPAGVGKSPSPMLGEVLCFEDACPADRRADFVDLRTTGTFPNPAQGAGNTGDGISDRFDHIFYQAPLDVNTATPAGIAGLNFGFLRYTNRLAPNGMGQGLAPNIIRTKVPGDPTDGQALGVTAGVLGDDATLINPIVWESLDPGHQVAGGDDQNPPFRGDDSDFWANPTPNPYPASSPNNPLLGNPLEGGFEFTFGEDVAGATGTLNTSLSALDGIFTFSLTSAVAASGFPLSGELTISSSSGFEIVHYTRSGNVFTIVRGQYGTLPRAFSAGLATVRFGNDVVDERGCSPWVWNAFFWNSNGNITFGTGDTTRIPSVLAFRANLPKIAPAWADLNPDARRVSCGTFPVMALGFANVNAFKIRWINVPEFGSEGCVGSLSAAGTSLQRGASNTFSMTLYDDGTGFDENTAEVSSTQAVNPATGISPVGNNINEASTVFPRFDQFEGPTDLRFTTVTLAGGASPGTTRVGCPPRRDGSGMFVFDFCRMDLLGTLLRPVITGYSIGFLNFLNPPGLCETNLSAAAVAADAGAFGVLTGNQIAAVGCNCCIGEGTEPTIFELFNEGRDASIGLGGETTFAKPDFDLRFEGNDPALCTSVRQRDLNRGHICFFGIGCQPADPTCSNIIAGAFVTTPTTTGLVNSLCAVTLNIVGCGFFPNESTIICQGFAEDTGIPLTRPGKMVTTSAALACDTNGDGIPESLVTLGNVTPVSCNLITATILPQLSRPGTGFPDACCGGTALVVTLTSFTDGDNNVFGPFTRSSACLLALGRRAPVVFSVTPSGGDCSLTTQDLLVSGACFCNPDGTFGITSAIFQDAANPANTITVGLNPSTSGQLKPLSCNLFDVEIHFTSANAGKTFLFFAVGPGGTSRNLTTLPTGAPVGCPIGNEQGTQVQFKCNAPGIPNPGPNPLDIAVVQTCHLDRSDTGQFFLDVTGTGIKEGATATVGGVTPKKIKVVEVAPGTTNPTKLRLLKKICNGLPGNVIITNPGPTGAPSQPFLCTERCPAN